MKKQTLLSTLVLSAAVFGLVGCGSSTKTVKGEFSYTSHNSLYGMAVEVTVDTKSKEITKVVRDADVITEKGLVETTPTSIGSWDGTAQGAAYTAAIESALNEYVGQNYETLYATIKENVSITVDGENVTIDVAESYASNAIFQIITGATQTSARTAYAIANAIAAIDANDELTPLA